MRAASTVALPLDDPDEAAYWDHRKLVRRRQLIAILCVASLVISIVAQRVVNHLTSAWWLEANDFVVLWGIRGTTGSRAARRSSGTRENDGFSPGLIGIAST